MLLFKDAEGAERAVIEMMKVETKKFRNIVATYVGLTEEEFSLAASILSEDLRGERVKGKSSIWFLPKIAKATHEAKRLAEKAKKKIKDPEIIVMCESVFLDVMEASSEVSKANLLIAAANFGGAKARFESCLSKAKSAAVGGNARAEQYNDTERVVIDIWKNECSPLDSADKAAEEIIGRVKLSHRRIADIIRLHKKRLKMLNATQEARNA